MRSGLTALALIALIGLAAMLAGAHSDRAARAAAASVSEGQPFAEAQQRLAAGSWRHSRCAGAYGDEHLFWYGVPIKWLASFVWVQTERRPDGEIVRAVATEPDYILLAVDTCG